MKMAGLKAPLSVVDLLLACDGGVMHVGSACECPVLAIFGTTSLNWSGPHDTADEVVLIDPISSRLCFDRRIHPRPFSMEGIPAWWTVDAITRAVGGLAETRATSLGPRPPDRRGDGPGRNTGLLGDGCRNE